MNLIRPVNFQTATVADAAGQSAFRAVLFSIPIGVVVGLVFPVRPPGTILGGALFLLSATLSFFLLAAINFLVGLVAIRTKSIQGIRRAKYLVLELLSGLLIPTTLFPQPLRGALFLSPFPHLNYTPAALYLGTATGGTAVRLLALQAAWTAALLAGGQALWRSSQRRITIQGG